jgi:predicted nucleic acid-binding Zn ribbon protein
VSGEQRPDQHRPDQPRPDQHGTDGEAGAGATTPEGDAGADAVRSALNRARASAAAKGLRPGALAGPHGTTQNGTVAGSGLRAAQARSWASRQGGRSGAHPDARDPQNVSSAIHRLVAERGWEAPVAVGGVIGRWEAVVGSEIAAHCVPETFEDGVLSVRADSTAWATQVRLLVPPLMRRMAEEVGEGMVTKVVVRGPQAPTWRKGPRVAPGSQGPRDTYG